MRFTYTSIVKRLHMKNKHFRIIDSDIAALIVSTALPAG